MVEIIDGTKVSGELKHSLKPRIQSLLEQNIRPGLGVILVGDNI